MARPLKIFLWIVGIFFGLIAIAAIAVPLLINPNNYKGQITTAAKDKTGRDLAIGDIKLRIFPWLGVKIAGVTVGNAEGFGNEPFAQVGEADVGVQLLPLLFEQRVMIGTVTLDGLVLNAARHKDGKTNWDDFTKSTQEPGKKQVELKPEHPGGKETPVALTVAGLKLTNSHVTFVDEQAGATYKIEEFDLKTGSVNANEPVDVDLSMKASSTKPQVAADLKVAMTVLPKLDEKIYEVQKLKVNLGTKGSGIPGGAQEVTFTAKALYDGGKGTMNLSDAALTAAGLVLNLALQAEGLNTDTAKLSGSISTNTFNPKDVAKKVGVELPPTSDATALTSASFSAKIAGTAKAAELDDIVMKLDQTNVTGHAGVADTATQALRFAFKVDAIDADRYMAPTPKGGDKKDAAGAPKADINKVELPVDALDQLNAQGTLDIGSLKASGAKLSDVAMKVNFPKGQVKTEELTAKLYGGSISNTTKITPGAKPRYDLQFAMKQVQVGTLEQDVMGKDYVSGTGDVTFSGNAAGKTVGDVRHALNGNLALSLVKGALEGINLQKSISQAKAALNGQAPASDNGPSRTEFSDMKASGTITNGVLRTNDLKATGSSVAFTGAGNIDIGNEMIDYTLTTNVTGDNPDLAQFKGTPIPVKVTGPWSDPKVRVDLESIAKSRAKEEVKKQGSKLLENLLKKH